MPVMWLVLAVTNPLKITLPGVIIALAFVSSIVGVLGWMLRLPEEGENFRDATKAVRSVHKLSRILVPLLHNSEASGRAVVLATQMALHRKGSVEVLAIIRVPFTLPLNAHMEQDEKHANEALERAADIAARLGPHTGGLVMQKRILKARDIGAAIVREAEDQAVDLILMANSPVHTRGGIQQIDPVVEYVMRHAPCEVLVLSQTHERELVKSQLNGAAPTSKIEQTEKVTIP
ncbi:MAG TPA: universal stress protein [Ktedonobacteraceae bacterium]|nr:universal stress protein [Ktedonobacteraceae bacterium]